MLKKLLLISLFSYFARADLNTKYSKNKVLNVDTIHKSINKDTVINRNLKMEKKARHDSKDGHRHGQKHHNKIQEAEPDWSYTNFPEEIKAHVDSFKKNMTECLKEVQQKEKKPVRMLSPGKDSPVHGECLIACVLKRNEVIRNGQIDKGNLLTLVGKFYAKDVKLMKKLEKNIDRCVAITSKERDECAMAAQLNSCTNDIMSLNKHHVTVNF